MLCAILRLFLQLGCSVDSFSLSILFFIYNANMGSENHLGRDVTDVIAILHNQPIGNSVDKNKIYYLTEAMKGL